MSDNLKNHIEVKRRMMIAAGEVLGLSHDVTIKLSVELDKLLNKAQKKGMVV